MKIQQTISDILLDCLYHWGITTIFAVPGAQVDPLLTKVAQDQRFQLVVAAHEQGAGYMADGYARMRRGPATAIAINGPGLTNIVTAAVTARVDNSPVLFITGDTPTELQGYGSFQGSDILPNNTVQIMLAALQNSVQINSSDELTGSLKRFADALQNGSPRPIHMNIPIDILRTTYDEEALAFPSVSPLSQITDEHPIETERLPQKLGAKVAMLVGDEIRTRAEMQAIAQLAEVLSVPVASTFAAKKIQSYLPNKLRLGVFGYAGGPRAFQALLDPDLEMLIVVGALLNERNTAAWSPVFFHNRRHILRFSTNRDTVRQTPRTITEIFSTRIIPMLTSILEQWKETERRFPEASLLRSEWCNTLQLYPLSPSPSDTHTDEDSMCLTIESAVLALRTELPENSILFLDSGDHRIPTGFFWWPGVDGHFFTSAQLAPMGWAISAAIGASFATEKPIWVISGDGCMLMHGMEIAIAARYHRRVIFLVSNNQSYGRIAARLKHVSPAVRSNLSSLPETDWSGFASSLGVQSQRVSTIDELIIALQQAKHQQTGPYLIEMMTTQSDKVLFSQAIFTACTPTFTKHWTTKTGTDSIP